MHKRFFRALFEAICRFDLSWTRLRATSPREFPRCFPLDAALKIANYAKPGRLYRSGDVNRRLRWQIRISDIVNPRFDNKQPLRCAFFLMNRSIRSFHCCVFSSFLYTYVSPSSILDHTRVPFDTTLDFIRPRPRHSNAFRCENDFRINSQPLWWGRAHFYMSHIL